jgi:hypothetical protein
VMAALLNPKERRPGTCSVILTEVREVLNFFITFA